MRGTHVALLVAGAAVVAILPWVLPPFYLLLATESLVFGLLAMSLDLLIGYAGLVSFGHAAFFGLGAYAAALALLRYDWPYLLALVAGGGASALAGVAVGYLSIRARGIYFAMLTLAFGEVLRHLVYEWKTVTGGSDGVAGITVTDIGLGPAAISVATPERFFYFVAMLTAAIGVALLALTRSRFGRTLKGIRENETRAVFIGVRVRRYKLAAFVLSTAIAGVAGAVYAPLAGFANPSLLDFALSGKVLVMTLLGGSGTLVGPLLGGVFLTWLETVLGSAVTAYRVALGMAVVLLVLFAPGGVYGLLGRLTVRRGAPGDARAAA